MKIAQIVCTFPPYKGGMGNSVFELCKSLSKQGHNITVFTPKYKSLAKKGEALLYGENNFKVVKLSPFLRFGNGAFLPQLLWKLKNFDIVHLHYPFFGGAEMVWLLKLLNPKIKLIIHYHMDSKLSFVFKIFSAPSKFIFNSLFENASAITCASLDYVKNSGISKIYKKYNHKFYEISFGVDINKFKSEENKKIDNKLNILFVGGLDKAHYFKGLGILLKAVSGFKKNSYKLRIVGDGNLREKYKEQAEKLGIKKFIKFAGRVSDEDLPDHYRKADVFVLPSINRCEAFGLVLLEAMACGTPVIASDLPGVRSVFKNNEHGFLVRPGSADDLANKIKIFLENKELIKKMGEAGRKLVEDEYDWNKVGKKLDLIYYFVQSEKI
ncbi:MAG: glycosyltransferase family 4 protein [Candidatus Falkowbacteria bacterium]